MELDYDRLAIGLALLNTYAHDYLGLPTGAIMVSGGVHKVGRFRSGRDAVQCTFIVAMADRDKAEGADTFDAAKAIIDDFQARFRAAKAN